MSDLFTDVETGRRAADALPPADRHPMRLPPTLVAQRRRTVRWVLGLSLIGGIGLSAIPGPTVGHERTVSSTDRGVTTRVHEFTYERSNGFPFAVVKTGIPSDGRGITSLKVEGSGILGNMAVAVAGAITLVAFMTRRRRSE